MFKTEHDHTSRHVELKQKLSQKMAQLNKVLDELSKTMPLSAMHIRSILGVMDNIKADIAIYDRAAMGEKAKRDHDAKLLAKKTSFSENEAKDLMVEDIMVVHNSK